MKKGNPKRCKQEKGKNMKSTKGEFNASDLGHINKALRTPIGRLISLKSSSVYSPSFSWFTVTASDANISCTFDRTGSEMERDCKNTYKGDGAEEEEEEETTTGGTEAMEDFTEEMGAFF